LLLLLLLLLSKVQASVDGAEPLWVEEGMAKVTYMVLPYQRWLELNTVCTARLAV